MRFINCSIAKCDKRAKARGWCDAHLARFYKYGNPETVFHPRLEGAAVRFWKQVAITANPEKCWLWNGATVTDGYGTFCVDRTRWGAHRYAWFLVNATEPQQHILHSCDNRRCVNPSHLREGTPRDNSNDKMTRHRHHTQSQTHCKHGHEFTEENTYIRPGATHRGCRACRQRSAREYQARRLVF